METNMLLVLSRKRVYSRLRLTCPTEVAFSIANDLLGGYLTPKDEADGWRVEKVFVGQEDGIADLLPTGMSFEDIPKVDSIYALLRKYTFIQVRKTSF